MRITIFGATGAVGSRTTAEALRRGHEVTAVARNDTRLKALAETLKPTGPAHPPVFARPGVTPAAAGTDETPTPGRSTGSPTPIGTTDATAVPAGTAAALAVPAGTTDTPAIPTTTTDTPAVPTGTAHASAVPAGTAEAVTVRAGTAEALAVAEMGDAAAVGWNAGETAGLRLRLRQGDASDVVGVARLSQGEDVVISATRPVPGQEDELAIAAKGLAGGLAGTGVRLVVVGGAASLRLPGSQGTTVVDGTEFPVELRPIALACNEQFEVVRTSDDVDWVYVSPPATLEPGVRTGQYRVGRDELLVDADGTSSISMEDFAVALLDEIERPRHRRTRFTVGY